MSIEITKIVEGVQPVDVRACLAEVKSGSQYQVVVEEQGGILIALLQVADGGMLEVIRIEVDRDRMRGFPDDLMKEIERAGYGEDSKLIFGLVYNPMIELAARSVRNRQTEVSRLALRYGLEPGAPVQGYMEGEVDRMASLVSFMQRTGVSLFSPEAYRTAREIVSEDFETLLLGAQARNDAAKARYLVTQLVAANQSMAKFGLRGSWTSMYEASAKRNGWPPLNTVEGFLTLLEQVYKPVVIGLLALPQVASELADIQVESELAQPRHDLEMQLLDLREVLEKAKQDSRGEVGVAVIEASAVVAKAKSEHAETFIQASRLDGYRRGAKIGAVGTVVGEALGNVLASSSALIFRPVDAIQRWAKNQEDPQMVAFVLGGLIVAVPLAATAMVAPWVIIAAPITTGAAWQAWRSLTRQHGS